MPWHIRKSLKGGFNEIVGEDNEDMEFLEFGILKLAPEETFEFETEKKEWGGVILSGKCTVSGEDFLWDKIGARPNVFAGKATGFYIPPNRSARLSADEAVEVALVKAPSDLDAKARLITPDEVQVKVVGAHNWKRYIHSILDTRTEAARLVVGETFNPPGNWSSFPPHCHDKHQPPEEVDMEEIYHFRLLPAQGFGIQRIYTDDRRIDRLYVLQDQDTVVIPEGYHPVAVAAGYRLYYLWMMAGTSRVLTPREDPNHAWVSSAEAIVKEL